MIEIGPHLESFLTSLVITGLVLLFYWWLLK